MTADITIATIPLDRKYRTEFGVVEWMADGHIVRFIEKDPEAPVVRRARSILRPWAVRLLGRSTLADGTGGCGGSARFT